METKVKAPKYENGTLICPNCGLPLVGVEVTYFRIECFVCKQPVGKIPINIMKKLFDDTPAPLLKEWLIEMVAARNKKCC